MRISRPLACAIALSATVIGYSFTVMEIAPTPAGLADHAASALLFPLLFAVAFKLPGRFPRALFTFLLTAVFSIFFLFNTLHYRFFHTWGEMDALQQWDDLITLGAAVRSLIRGPDIVFLAVIPFLLWAAAQRGNAISEGRRALAGLGMALICFVAAHHWLASPGELFSESDPLFYALRIKAALFYSPPIRLGSPEEERRQAIRFQLLNKTVYSRPAASGYPLEKTPLPKRSALPFAIQTRPNVVIILMESVRALECGAYGGSPTLTPNLDRLAAQGIQFQNFYANGCQTVRAEFAIQTSYLPRLVGAPEYRQCPKLSVLTLPQVLKMKGYRTLWISSYSPTYDDKIGFLSAHGIESFYSDPPTTSPKRGWGPPDEDLFRYVRDVLSKEKQPFFAEVMTLSNHYPWQDGIPTASQTPPVRGESLYQSYAQGIYYTDYAIGQFLEAIRGTPLAENTVFVVLGDHGIWLFPERESLRGLASRQEAYFRIPCLLWSPRLLKPQRIAALGSQIDLAPTILDLLDIAVPNAFLGTSLFRDDTDKRFVLMVHDGRWNLRRGSDYDYDAGPELFESHFPFRSGKSEDESRSRRLHFTSSDDVLRSQDEARGMPLGEEASRDMDRFGTEALGFYNALMTADGIWPRN